MAEVFCDVSGIDPLGAKMSCNLPGNKRPKALNAAFPREIVEAEVRLFLMKHVGHLELLDEAFIRCLMEDWTAIPCPEIKLPSRFGQALPDGTRTKGGLLFGQLIPRFDNRIIARCPITYERVYQSVLADTDDAEQAKHRANKESKVPTKDCREFLRFRWAMQVANIRVAQDGSRDLKALDSRDRKALDQAIPKEGYFTPSGLKSAVRRITGGVLNNLDQLLLHPDAADALLIEPARKALARTGWGETALGLPDGILNVVLNKLRRGVAIDLDWIISFHPAAGPLFEAAATATAAEKPQETREGILMDWKAQKAEARIVSGRAPFSREVMREVDEFVFSTNRHPLEGAPAANDNGPLYRSESIRQAQLLREVDEQTNNRLVRHRLLILERLHKDILNEFAEGDPNRISQATIEVNRDLREMSGKTTEDIKKELGSRLGNFKSVATKLGNELNPHGIRASASLIRKARIADDLGWKCPYTGQSFDALDLHARTVDKDHIIPRSQRPSDSLDSLAITFSEVNRMKGAKTAFAFIQEFGGQPVPGRPGLFIQTAQQFETFVKSLDTRKGHIDDQKRKKKRKDFLLLDSYVEKEFTPRDLTQTSQLVRMGAQMLERAYLGNSVKPAITSLPGSVTGTIRKAWNLTGCLAAANPLVLNPDDLDQNGNPRPHAKAEIRGITHLHHALDACVLAFASLYLPRDGGIWEMLVKRRLTTEEARELRARLGGMVQVAADGTFQISELPNVLKEQIWQRLAEKRVFQHSPTRKHGLRVDQNAWRVLGVNDGVATLRQRMRQADGTKTTKETTKKVSKVLGVSPIGGTGKLQKNQAGLVIRDNYGIALDPEPQIIPFHKVHQRLCELTRKNAGKPPRVLRKGMFIEIPNKLPGRGGDYRGVWIIKSAKLTEAYGFCLDLGTAEGISLARGNARLDVLLRSGMRLLKSTYTGIPQISHKST
jgi:CRISPR-associated endonuclease Csn1